MSEKKIIGIMAGEGALPRYIAEEALLQNYQVFIVCHNYKSYFALQNKFTKAEIIALGQVKKWQKFWQDNQVKKIIAIGKFHKLELISQIPRVDSLAIKYVKKLINFEDNTFHEMVDNAIGELGFEFMAQSYFLKKHFAKPGHYTNRKLTETEQKDLDYGIDMAQKAASLEVSQTVIVKNQAVMAFEAVEGTDKTIIRGCKYAKDNAVIIKTPWGKQSDKFDLPTIGPRTIKHIAKNKGSVLAVKAGSTFIVEFDTCVKLANQYNIAFLGF